MYRHSQIVYFPSTMQKKISDSIAVALRTVHGRSVTASDVLNNSQNLHDFIVSNQAYLFMRNIPGSPAYWKKFMYEVLAMVKQLEIPTWFMTLSCADLRWIEIFQIIAITRNITITYEELDHLHFA